MILLVSVVIGLFFVSEAWTIPVIAAGLVLEVGETLVTWRLSRMWRPKMGPETLVGAQGRAVTRCRPDGTVRVQGVDWQARCEPGVDADAPVRVVGRERLVLLVTPADAP